MSAAPSAAVTGGPIGGVVERCVRWYGRTWLEIFRLPVEVLRGAVGAHVSIVGYSTHAASLPAGL